MNGLWLPEPPPGFVFRPVAPAPAPDRPKAKLGFDPARIAPTSTAQNGQRNPK